MSSGILHERMLCGMALAGILAAGVLSGAEKDPGDGKNAVVTSAEVQRLIIELGDSHFAKREAAQRVMMAAVETNSEVLVAECVPAYARTGDPEVRVRLRDVLNRVFEVHVLNRPQGFLGIGMNLGLTLDEKGEGIRGIQVTGVLPNTQAATVDLHEGDLITGIDAFDMKQEPLLDAFSQYIRGKQPGEAVKLTLRRGEETRTLDVKLGALSEQARNQVPGARVPAAEQFKAWLRDRLKETKKP